MQYRVYDKNGDLKRIIEKRQESKLGSDEWLKGVTCFILNENGEVLIEKRANKGLTPGQLDLCSGHLDGDETPTQAMIRELGEELGIETEEAMNVIKLTQDGIPFEFENSGRTLRFLITAYCLKRNSSKVIIQKEEVDSVKWIQLEKCLELIKNGKTKFPESHEKYDEVFQKVIDIRDGRKINGTLER